MPVALEAAPEPADDRLLRAELADAEMLLASPDTELERLLRLLSALLKMVEATEVVRVEPSVVRVARTDVVPTAEPDCHSKHQRMIIGRGIE